MKVRHSRHGCLENTVGGPAPLAHCEKVSHNKFLVPESLADDVDVVLGNLMFGASEWRA